MKAALVIAVIAIVALVAFFLMRGDGAPNETASPSPTATVTVSPSPTPTASPTQTVSPTPSPVVKVVTYTDAGFSPSTVTIKAGEAVTFRNNSTKLMWVASGPHPAHSLYPVKGGCTDSAFDQCVGGAVNQSWSFTFSAKGTWPYHNHLSSSHTGKVVVQ
ncbi:MAG TPA: hypothetical protein VJJ72_03010 [Candidatus Paceibacterota bacterium]